MRRIPATMARRSAGSSDSFRLELQARFDRPRRVGPERATTQWKVEREAAGSDSVQIQSPRYVTVCRLLSLLVARCRFGGDSLTRHVAHAFPCFRHLLGIDLAPLVHRHQDGFQALAKRRERVFHLRRHLSVDLSPDEASGLHLPQLLGECSMRDSGQGAVQLAEPLDPSSRWWMTTVTSEILRIQMN